MRRWAQLAVSVAVLVGAVVVLHGAGHPLSPPPLRTPGRWTAWVAAREPVVVAFSLARLAALAVAWYLLAVTVLGAAARAVRAAPLARVLDRVTVGPIRRMLAATLSVSLVTAAATTVAGSPGARPAAAVAAYQAAPPTPPPTVTMHRLPDVAAAEASPAVPADRWEVEPGQCFWSIAEAVLRRAQAGVPSEAEIAAYWHRLIDANRTVLADPGNPDLVFPGQVLAVPAPPGDAAASLAATG